MSRRRSNAQWKKQEETSTKPVRTAQPEMRRKPRPVYAKSENQRHYMGLLRDASNVVILAIGPAGTGKTLLACHWAIQALQNGEVEKIIITRPAVSVDEEHGFLPGSIQEKMEPWTKPIMDVLSEYYSGKEIAYMISNGVLETSPLAYMRGRTFKYAAIIADEMQNATPSQMKMLLTRVGTGSRMVVTGDLNQADRPKDNGLLDFLNLFNGFENHQHVQVCQFTPEDVERHEAVKEILRIYGEID